LASIIEYPFFLHIANGVDEHISALTQRRLWETYQIPVIDYYFSANPVAPLSMAQLIGLNVFPVEELKFLNRLATRINAILRAYFERREAVLLSFDCFFGGLEGSHILIGDFTPMHISALAKSSLDQPTAGYFDFNTAKELKVYVEFLIQSITQ
jgi:hypothetical protein